MNRLSRKLAHRWTHEVAAWLEYERMQGAFAEREWLWWGSWSVGEYLTGACHIASCILRRALEFRGYRAGVVFDPFNHHAYVATACGWTLDPTFMQFADEYGGPYQPSIERTRPELEHGLVGIVPRALLHADGRLQGPSWAGFHRDVIERVLRRMGVEGSEASP
jgi:hypothetical protein